MTIKCPRCGSKNLVKQGKTGKGTQKWQCNSCKKHFRRNTATAHSKLESKRK
ncbi:MAG: hypothetical protein LBF67_07350 [Prevotellaceae bacterium]|nr:hypothetical protein [Prevotellaceae bacterium]